MKRFMGLAVVAISTAAFANAPHVLYDDVDNTYHPQPMVRTRTPPTPTPGNTGTGSTGASGSPSGGAGSGSSSGANSKNRSGQADGTNPGKTTQDNGGTNNPGGSKK